MLYKYDSIKIEENDLIFITVVVSLSKFSNISSCLKSNMYLSVLLPAEYPA